MKVIKLIFLLNFYFFLKAMEDERKPIRIYVTDCVKTRCTNFWCNSKECEHSQVNLYIDRNSTTADARNLIKSRFRLHFATKGSFTLNIIRSSLNFLASLKRFRFPK